MNDFVIGSVTASFSKTNRAKTSRRGQITTRLNPLKLKQMWQPVEWRSLVRTSATPRFEHCLCSSQRVGPSRREEWIGKGVDRWQAAVVPLVRPKDAGHLQSDAKCLPPRLDCLAISTN